MTAHVITVKAFAVLLNESGDAHLVWRGADVTKTPSEFHRLLGGHVEFGEATAAAVEREIREETGVELGDPRLLGVLENRFMFQEQPGHEIVFVYAGTWCASVPLAGRWLSDNGQSIWVEWRPVRPLDPTLPLYPQGTQALIDTMVGSQGLAPGR